MKKSVKRGLLVIFVVLAFSFGIGVHFVNLAVSGEKWATYPANKHIYSNGIIYRAGEITDTNGVKLAYSEGTERRFSSDADIRKATIHAVGDLKGYVSTGMHSAYLSELCGYDILSGVYEGDNKGNNIELTIDAQLSVTAYKALGSYSGTVGVYNYKTGEIVCMVSTPTFDPYSQTEASGDGVYVNRLLSGVYAPGSIFKLVTALSALENAKDPDALEFYCDSGVMIGGEKLTCMSRHKTIGLEDALVHSCNAFFASTALTLGKNKLTATAEKVGFNKSLSVDGIKCATSRYEVKDSNDIDFGWSGIGQHNDLVNPFQYLTFMGAIAGDGEMVYPYLVKKLTSSSGITLKSASKKTTKIMSSENADKLQKMMRNNVIKNYGDYRFSGLEVCGKTGTAEVGDKSTPHSWFTGFCASEDKPYAFVVIVENAGAGKGVATSVAAKVLKSIK